MTLKGAKKKLKENRTETEHNFEVVQKLNQIKDLLIDIKKEL